MLLAAAFCLAASNSVLAADMSVPRVSPPPFIYNWSGFYLGAHVGYAWDQRDASVSDSTGVLALDSTRAGSLIGGGQIGYNFALTPLWILGIEADVSGSSMGSTVINLPNLGQRVYNIDDFGTVRARIGYACNQILIYGTGGFAWAHEVVTRTQQIGVVNNAIPGVVEERGTIAPGWTAGLGLEWGVSPGWVLRAEYLHLDFGNRTFLFPAAGQRIDASVNAEVLRFGVSYLFNIGARPAY
ncbi:MAG TPA: outer membrane beta-barrel protein [Pseudolabrys sp.]|nr:outer membrane beta-barrel protein [Pseudolabrys sp.]